MRLSFILGVVFWGLNSSLFFGNHCFADGLNTSFLDLSAKSTGEFSEHWSSYDFHSSSAPIIQASVLPSQSSYRTDSRFDANTSQLSNPKQCLEITPLWAYTMGGRLEDEDTDETIKISDASSVGLRIAYGSQEFSQIEFLYSHQETELSDGDSLPQDALFDLDVDYYHIGGSIVLDQGQWRPYFTGSVGLTRFDPEDSDIDSEVRPSLGFGGGVHYFPIKRVGLYLGARALVTFFNSEFEAESQSEGTTVHFESDAIWQFQVFSGVTFVF
jgi:hypothetical protein